MSKNMAKLKDNIVVNVEWRDDETAETAVLKNIGDRPVNIGDRYADGGFFRGDAEVLTPLEEAMRIIHEYEVALAEIENALGVAE